MLHHRRWLSIGLTLFFSLLCSVGLEAAQSSALVSSRDADDTARFIAGLPGTPGSPFADLETSEAWKEHRIRMDEDWGNAEFGLIGGLREFQKQQLDSSALRNSTVFYPFGGPDALNLTVLFPQSPVYVIVGLEPAGTLPGVAQIQKTDLAKYLSETRATTASVLGRSFFITREMDRQFRGQITDGLMVPILHLLVRTRHTILGFRYVRIDERNQVIERATSYRAPGRFGNKGVEIEFKTDSDQTTHKLFYFAVNLSNERLRENAPFQQYLSHLSTPTTFFKATSYMTHRANFSLIRDLVLSNSGAILQDDSGIPYRFFRPGGWTVELYGDYTRPYGSFRWLEQPELRKAYQASGPKPLPMRIGYGYSQVASNLLLATRTSRISTR
jgi:hypothetical protein